LLWIAAPLTGLLVQPIIGYLSDRTWHPRFGRRRPFFLIGAVLSSIALFFMPYSSTLWMAAGFLWILDASINISMNRSAPWSPTNFRNSNAPTASYCRR
jgi:maltose/moltooligosaccharide transporter